MMKSLQSMEGRLWDYIDGMSGLNEKAAIEKLLQENEDWKNAYQLLTEMHTSLRSAAMEQPSMRFTKNIMDNIAAFQLSPSIKYINKKVIWSIVAFVIVLISGFLIYAFTQVNWGATGSVQLRFSPGKIDISSIFNNTSLYLFMMTNVVLALMLLDRFLSRKKADYQSASRA